MTERDDKGRFVKGCRKPEGSGRQRMTMTAAELRELARDACPDALKSLIYLSEHGTAAVRVQACRELLDRAYGKALLPVEVAGPVPVSYDLSRLSVEQLRALREIVRQAMPPALQAGESAG